MDLIGLERVQVDQLWIWFIMLYALLYLGLNKLFYGSKLFDLMTSRFSRSYRSMYYGESQRILSFFNISNFLFQCLLISCVIMLIGSLGWVELTYGYNKSFLIVLLIVMSVLIVRIFLVYVFSAILRLEDIYFRLLTYTFNYVSVIRLWLMPLHLIYFIQGANSSVFGFLMLLLLAVMLVVMGVLILINNKYLLTKDLFYFILYLCTFEIAPILIVFKTLVY